MGCCNYEVACEEHSCSLGLRQQVIKGFYWIQLFNLFLNGRIHRDNENLVREAIHLTDVQKQQKRQHCKVVFSLKTWTLSKMFFILFRKAAKHLGPCGMYFEKTNTHNLNVLFADQYSKLAKCSLFLADILVIFYFRG